MANFIRYIGGGIGKGLRAYKSPYKTPSRSSRDPYISTVRSNVGTSLRLYENFDEQLWEESYTEIIAAQEEKAGNAGQETLLGEQEYFIGAAENYCSIYGEDYDPQQFVSRVRSDLGDDYYNAIREIIDECAVELEEAWAQCWSDGEGGDLFTGALDFGGFYNSNSIYGTFGNAARIQSNLAFVKYGGYGTPAHLAAKQSTIVNFLAANPNGRSRVTPSTPFAGRTVAQSRAISRRTASKFLSQFPKGRVSAADAKFRAKAKKFRGNP
jgi:hypothetical protein